MESNFVYGFDKQKTFKSRYIARNTKSSQKQRGNNKNSIGR